MFKKEDEFDNEILKHWGRKVVFLDGIADIKQYKRTNPKKLLWILKEPNKSKQDKIENLRELFLDVTIFQDWQHSYKRIMLASDMIFNDSTILPDIDILLTEERYPINKIAIINVNKNGGNSKSNQKAINMHYKIKKEKLLEQVKGIAPDIIINCSLVDDFYNDIIHAYKLNNENIIIDNFKRIIGYAYNSKKLLINYYHPNCHRKGMTDEWYCENILKIYNKWQKLINKLST